LLDVVDRKRAVAEVARVASIVEMVELLWKQVEKKAKRERAVSKLLPNDDAVTRGFSSVISTAAEFLGVRTTRMLCSDVDAIR